MKRNEIFAANRAGTLAPRRRRLLSTSVAQSKTFAEALEVFIAERRAGYKGIKEIVAFGSLARLPLARLPLDQIDRNTVKASLAQWFGTPTAEKMRVRVSQVFKHEGRIGSDNPAAQLKGGLPALANPVEHHLAMP